MNTPAGQKGDLMDLRSMVTFPVRVALLPARITVHFLFALGDRWVATPTSLPVDVLPDNVEGDEQWA